MKDPYRSSSPLQAALLTVATIIGASPSAFAAEAAVSSADTGSLVPGARVDELLELGRRLNPGLAASALEAQAAQARIGTAGRFPDPIFKTELFDVQAARNALPQ